jgi:hypothetical protein
LGGERTEEVLSEGEVGEALEEGPAETVDLSLGDWPGGVDAALVAMGNSIKFRFKLVTVIAEFWVTVVVMVGCLEMAGGLESWSRAGW